MSSLGHIHKYQEPPPGAVVSELKHLPKVCWGHPGAHPVPIPVPTPVLTLLPLTSSQRGHKWPWGFSKPLKFWAVQNSDVQTRAFHLPP